MIGTIVDVDAAGSPVVCLSEESAEGIAAGSLIPIDAALVGRRVAITFERGRPDSPIIVGLLHPPTPPSPAVPRTDGGEASGTGSNTSIAAEIDGERITLTAAREIVLRCGDASITLTRAGKILIRGAYVLSDSSTVNRIRGGSVQIN